MIFNQQVSSEGLEKAMGVLFRRPALEFSRKLRANLDKDPEYLTSHKTDVFPVIQHILSEAGAPLDEKTLDEQMSYVIREVVVRLRTIEKGKG
jgi:hypothetical protein